MNYVSVFKSVGKWVAETNEGQRVELTYVPRRQNEHLIDATGEVVAKKCSVCNKMELATTEHFRVDSRRLAGLQQKCKACHSEYDKVNKRFGLSVNGGPKRTQKPKAQREFNDHGECVRKVCPSCETPKDSSQYTKWASNSDGLKEYCKDCYSSLASPMKVSVQNFRAIRHGLPGTLTAAEWKYAVNEVFESGCALTGDTDNVAFEHMMPLSSGQGGTTIWNVYPISQRLNSSKGKRNFFEWIELPHVKAQIDQQKVEKLIEHLSSQCDMNPREYKAFYNWMYRNQQRTNAGMNSLEYYKLVIRGNQRVSQRQFKLNEGVL
jgi:hypothetical protein